MAKSRILKNPLGTLSTMATYFNCFLFRPFRNGHLSTKAIATKMVPNYQFFQRLMKKARKVMKFDSYREEKSLRHVAKVAKFLDDNKLTKPLKSLFALNISNFTDLIQFHLIWQILRKFSSEPYLLLSKFRKRKRQFLCCVHLLHKVGS